MAKFGIALEWGSRGRWFESSHSDQGSILIGCSLFVIPMEKGISHRSEADANKMVWTLLKYRYINHLSVEIGKDLHIFRKVLINVYYRLVKYHIIDYNDRQIGEIRIGELIRQMKNNQLKPYVRAGVTAFVVILVALVACFMLINLQQISQKIALIQHILRPIYLGLIIAYLLLPVHKALFAFLCDNIDRKNESKRRTINILKGVSILLSLLFAFAVLYVLLAMVIPQVYVSVVGLVKAIPDYINTAQLWIMGFLEDNPEIQEMFLSAYNPAVLTIEDWLNNEIIPNLNSLSSTFEWLRGTLLPNITGVIFNVSSVVAEALLLVKDIFIGVIVSIYLLASKDIFAAQSKKIVYSILPPQYGDMFVEETRNAYRIMSGFINGKLLDSLIIGVITLVCCNIFDFPYPALIAMIIGVTNIIPFFGPFIGAIPSAFLILLVDPIQSVYFCVFILVLQQFDGNILGPKILGESTGLASFWVLLSIILAGGLFGFAGMVLGVPCFAILYSILKRVVNSKLRRRNLSENTADYICATGKVSEQIRMESVTDSNSDNHRKIDLENK